VDDRGQKIGGKGGELMIERERSDGRVSKRGEGVVGGPFFSPTLVSRAWELSLGERGVGGFR